MTAAGKFSLLLFTSSLPDSPTKLGFLNFPTSSFCRQRLAPIKSMEGSRMPAYKLDVEVKPNGIIFFFFLIYIVLFDLVISFNFL